MPLKGLDPSIKKAGRFHLTKHACELRPVQHTWPPHASPLFWFSLATKSFSSLHVRVRLSSLFLRKRKSHVCRSEPSALSEDDKKFLSEVPACNNIQGLPIVLPAKEDQLQPPRSRIAGNNHQMTQL